GVGGRASRKGGEGGVGGEGEDEDQAKVEDGSLALEPAIEEGREGAEGEEATEDGEPGSGIGMADFDDQGVGGDFGVHSGGWECTFLCRPAGARRHAFVVPAGRDSSALRRGGIGFWG